MGWLTSTVQAWTQSTRSLEDPDDLGRFRHSPSPPLIRGSGVRVPGDAPVLTWGYARLRTPCEGRFRPVFAPRLFVSPDLVVRVAGTPCEALTDSNTEHDICRHLMVWIGCGRSWHGAWSFFAGPLVGADRAVRCRSGSRSR